MSFPLLARNRLLAAVSSSDLEALQNALEVVELTPRCILFEQGQPIDAVYFPLSGLINLSLVAEDGDEAACAVVGPEGLVGLGGLVSGDTSFSRQTVQLGGRAARVPRTPFLELIENSRPFRILMTAHHDAFAAQLLQLVFCQAMHTAEQRVVRWLLTAFAAVRDTTSLSITQEALAVGLGMQRATVTIALNDLANRGAVAIERGRLTLTSLPQLEARSCPCYRIINDNYVNALVPRR